MLLQPRHFVDAATKEVTLQSGGSGVTHTPFTCAICGQSTSSHPCASCGADPLLGGVYRLLEVLGQGPSATTWRALDARTGELVALKELTWRPGDAQARRRALREARVLGELCHVDIPRLREHLLIQQGRHHAFCIVSDFIPGQTLQEEVLSRRYSAAEVLDLLEALLGTLIYLHERSPPIVHRDIKPANIIRHAQTGRILLIDFSAVCDERTDPDLGSMTASGTFGYMAPEQLQGRAEPRTDLYGLGALAVALLTRQDPHTLLDHTHCLQWEDRVALPSRMRGMLRKLLASTPEQRYRSARAARTSLRSVRSMIDGREAERVQLPAPGPEPVEVLLRRIVREELQEALARHGGAPLSTQRPAVPPVLAQNDPMLPAVLVVEPSALAHPARLGALQPQPRRGWWEPRPMTLAERQRPPHPAVQLVLTTGLFGAVAIGLQLVLSALL